MSKIAIYTRKSVAIENSESIQTQIDKCKKYFPNETDFEIFIDEGFTGGNTNRPAFKRMMNLIKLNTFDVVATYKVDRIARNIVDFVDIYNELQNNNVALVSVTEGFDPTNPMGRMMMIVLAAFADMERENIRQRVRDNMLSLAKKGCFTGGPAPYGCTIEKKGGKSYLKIVDSELIQLIFNKYLELGSLYSTHNYLLDNGITLIKNRTGINRLLRNPVYVQSCNEVSDYLKNNGFDVIGENNGYGYLTYGKTSGTPIAIVSKHLAPITPELFLKVQRKLDNMRDSIAKNTSKTYFLTNTLTCPYCNSKYTLVNSGRNTYYCCSKRLNRTELGLNKNAEKCENNKYINSQEIEDRIDSLMIKLSENNDRFKQIYKSQNSNLKQEDKTIVLEKAIKDNEKQISNLIDKLSLLSSSASQFILNKIEELSNKNLELTSKLEEEKLKNIENLSTLSQEEIFDTINTYSKDLPAKEKRKTLQSCFKSIYYHPITKEINLEFL